MTLNLAGAYEEVLRHVEAHAEGQPLTTVLGFEEREARFKAP